MTGYAERVCSITGNHSNNNMTVKDTTVYITILYRSLNHKLLCLQSEMRQDTMAIGQ